MSDTFSRRLDLWWLRREQNEIERLGARVDALDYRPRFGHRRRRFPSHFEAHSSESLSNRRIGGHGGHVMPELREVTANHAAYRSAAHNQDSGTAAVFGHPAEYSGPGADGTLSKS
jgi:hypothetical protein